VGSRQRAMVKGRGRSAAAGVDAQLRNGLIGLAQTISYTWHIPGPVDPVSEVDSRAAGIGSSKESRFSSNLPDTVVSSAISRCYPLQFGSY